MREAFIEYGQGRGANRPRTDLIAPSPSHADGVYALKTMDGIIPSMGVSAVRINSDLLTFPNSTTGMRREKVGAAPGGRFIGLVLIFSMHTGEPLAIFPDGVGQAMRVGATSALAADVLARKDAKIAAVLGSGWQAREQSRGLAAIRELKEIRVYSPTPEHRERFASEMTIKTNVPHRPCSSVEEAVTGAAIVHCATNTNAAVVQTEHLEPGMHIGTIRPAAAERHREAWEKVDRLVLLHREDHAKIIKTAGTEIGEERNGGPYNHLQDEFYANLPTLPAILTGQEHSRTNEQQITAFFNNGMGYQFAAAGKLIIDQARKHNVGHELPTEWFTQDVHT
ncbi:MAG: alanine dehydrogenase [Gammaproteobacteria bacterium]|jgi:alanine dehydrogenase